MTIFRVNTDRDRATIIKAFPKTAEFDKKWAAEFGELWDIKDEMQQKLGPLRKKLLSRARKVYTKADRALKEIQKDKNADKDEVKNLIEARKKAYDLGKLLRSSAFDL